MRDDAAEQAVQHHDPDHEAGYVVALAIEVEVKVPGQCPQDADKAAQRDHRIEQTHAQADGRGSELGDVLLNTLVRVVLWQRGAAGRLEASQFDAVKTLVGQPLLQVLVCHPGAPAQRQQLRQIEGVDRGDDEGQRQIEESPQLLPEDRRVFFLQGVVEHPPPFVQQHRQVDRPQVQRNDGAQQQPGLEFLFRGEVGPGQGPHAAHLLAGCSPASGESSGRGCGRDRQGFRCLGVGGHVGGGVTAEIA